MACYFNRDQCKRWLECQHLHPITGKKLVEGTPTYYRLLKACEVHGLEPPYIASHKWNNPSFKGCTKWRSIKDECDDFGITMHIMCSNCTEYCDPQLFHNPASLDFECSICLESVSVVYLCRYCASENKQEDADGCVQERPRPQARKVRGKMGKERVGRQRMPRWRGTR